jgi:predicted 3-demethylubiquinone-9 3-methyltransferase (glyoxalase superfamily)
LAGPAAGTTCWRSSSCSPGVATWPSTAARSSTDEAISIQVFCDTQAEIDRLWAALSTQPGAEQCGGCKDRFGLSWHVVPSALSGWLAGPNGCQVMQAFMPMKNC